MKQDESQGCFKHSYVPPPYGLFCERWMQWGGGGAKEIKSKKRIILKPINTHCMVFNTIHSKTNDHE